MAAEGPYDKSAPEDYFIQMRQARKAYIQKENASRLADIIKNSTEGCTLIIDGDGNVMDADESPFSLLESNPHLEAIRAEFPELTAREVAVYSLVDGYWGSVLVDEEREIVVHNKPTLHALCQNLYIRFRKLFPTHASVATTVFQLCEKNYIGYKVRFLQWHAEQGWGPEAYFEVCRKLSCKHKITTEGRCNGE